MATNIEWCTEVWNVVSGCSKISPGCLHCYAERMSKRLAGRFGYPAADPFRVTFHKDKLWKPMKWMKQRRVFVCSMGDLFHKDVLSTWVDKVLEVIIRESHHTFIILTKRPERMRDYLCGIHDNAAGVFDRLHQSVFHYHSLHGTFISMRLGKPIRNLWIGVTVENNDQRHRVDTLCQIPAAVRFVSVEPMLGPVDLQLSEDYDPIGGLRLNKDMIHWVICGGETGPGWRYMNPFWAYDLHKQCETAGVPFFMKKMAGGGKPPDDLMVREYPKT